LKLYIMRHGPAEDVAATGRDADRVLTTPGRERVSAVVGALIAAEEAPQTVLSSPLARARETAEIVATAGRLAVEERRELAPAGDVLRLVGELVHGARKRVMVVGHEPDLSDLVADLIGHPPDGGMQKASVIGVKVTPTGLSTFEGKLRFILDPKSLVLHRR
jgi:phosphohistidine phosphatase